MTCLREGVVDLSDGRRLGYGEYGHRGGTPVLMFHGVPGGRQLDIGPAKGCGAWAFVLERPGYGLSDPQPGRKLTDWPNDVAAFADHFQFDRFAVAGFSGGGPYALVCGHDLPDRVTKVGLICAFVSFAEDPALDRIYPDWLAERISQMRNDPDAARAAMEHELAEASDQWAADPDGFFREVFGPAADSMPDSWKAVMGSTYGVPPNPDDQLLLDQPMGFDVTQIRVPIHAWYGDQDPLLAAGQELRRRVPSMKLTLYPGEGHFIEDPHRIDWLRTLAEANLPAT